MSGVAGGVGGGGTRVYRGRERPCHVRVTERFSSTALTFAPSFYRLDEW